MASTRKAREQHQIPPESAVAGILALLIDEREERAKDSKTTRKIEILLANAGLSVDDIVALTGNKAGAIRKAIQRGRAK